ncbi:MAG: hypothetical protein NT062_18730 [Proteobacteria bacterium]|nr:hypothetical protein [Pseudomonadota bacterium]
MSAKFLDEPARAAFDRAVKTIEAASSIEVVVAVRRGSGTYFHVNALVGFLATFAALAVALYAAEPLGYLSILIDPFVVGLIAAGLVQLVPILKRLATPLRILRGRVSRAARSTFVERGVHNTIERTGLLVYISWLEQQVVLVPDSGLAARMPVALLAQIEAAMTDAMPRGGEAVARRLEELASHAGVAMPRHEGDVNELPDVIDSDLRGARHAP